MPSVARPFIEDAVTCPPRRRVARWQRELNEGHEPPMRSEPLPVERDVLELEEGLAFRPLGDLSLEGGDAATLAILVQQLGSGAVADGRLIGLEQPRERRLVPVPHSRSEASDRTCREPAPEQNPRWALGASVDRPLLIPAELALARRSTVHQNAPHYRSGDVFRGSRAW